jgi:hypothetical protein
MTKKKMFTAAVALALPVFAAVGHATPAHAVGGDRGVSGCWEWSSGDGCTQYADCWVRAGFCIVSERVGPFTVEYIVTW